MTVNFDDELGDPFGDDLGPALRATAGAFQPEDPRRLVAEGHLRGRRLRRRRAATVTAGAAALAAVAVGGVLAGTAAGGSGGGAGVAAAPERAATTAKPPAATARPATRPTAAAVTGKRVDTVLSALLPKGMKVTRHDYTGQDEGYATATVVVDDGHGAAAVSVIVESGGGAAADCAAAAANGDWCRVTTVRGGQLTIVKGWEYPDHRRETKDWEATYVLPDGRQVGLSQWNSPQEKDAPITRAEPPLDVDQMAALVTSTAWKPLLAGLDNPVKGWK